MPGQILLRPWSARWKLHAEQLLSRQIARSLYTITKFCGNIVVPARGYLHAHMSIFTTDIRRARRGRSEVIAINGPAD